jgi:hypothetical protein
MGINVSLSTREKMIRLIQARSTDQLFADLAELDSRRVNGFLPLEEQRLVHAMISDVIETRHDLSAAMDAIFLDENYAGSYSDALRLAYVATVETE